MSGQRENGLHKNNFGYRHHKDDDSSRQVDSLSRFQPEKTRCFLNEPKRQFKITLANHGPLDSGCNAKRILYRSLIETLVFNTTDVVNAELLLWKEPHLRMIESYREKFKSPKQQAGATALVYASFRSFLSDSIGFYLELIRKLQERAQLKIVHQTVIPKLELYPCHRHPSEKWPIEDSQTILVIHRCLVRLGDLARYRDLHSGRSHKEAKCELAKRFYQIALDLLPENGHPYNQLSVVASNCETDYLGSLELSFRSIVIKTPYAIALSNIRATCEGGLAKVQQGCSKPNSLPPTFASEFKAHIGHLLNKTPSLQNFTSGSDLIVSKLRTFLSNSALRRRLNISSDDIKSILIISLGTLYICETPHLFGSETHPPSTRSSKANMDQSAQMVSGMLSFIWKLFTVVFEHASEKFAHQLQNHVLWDSKQHGTGPDALDFLEPFLLHIKLALTFLVKRISANEATHPSTPTDWKSVADICTTVSKAFGMLENCSVDDIAILAKFNLKEDMDWQNFLVLQTMEAPPISVFNDELSEHKMIQIRMAKILALATQLCTLQPLHLVSLIQPVKGHSILVFSVASTRSNAIQLQDMSLHEPWDFTLDQQSNLTTPLGSNHSVNLHYHTSHQSDIPNIWKRPTHSVLPHDEVFMKRPLGVSPIGSTDYVVSDHSALPIRSDPMTKHSEQCAMSTIWPTEAISPTRLDTIGQPTTLPRNRLSCDAIDQHQSGDDLFDDIDREVNALGYLDLEHSNIGQGYGTRQRFASDFGLKEGTISTEADMNRPIYEGLSHLTTSERCRTLSINTTDTLDIGPSLSDEFRSQAFAPAQRHTVGECAPTQSLWTSQENQTYGFPVDGKREFTLNNGLRTAQDYDKFRAGQISWMSVVDNQPK
ncbi:hypothetical protein BDV3_004706 [Batrachochytrium dendrobatidis]